MAALGPHWAGQVATSQPDSFLNQSHWKRDNGQVKHSSHMTPTHRRQLARARTGDLWNFPSNLNLPALLTTIFPGRTTPLVTSRCISNYPGTSELFQKISRLCLNMKMALMMLLVVSFKRMKRDFWREILLHSTVPVRLRMCYHQNCLRSTSDLKDTFVKIILFCHSFSHEALTHFTTTTCEYSYSKSCAIMFVFQQTYSTCDCQLHALLLSFTVVTESPMSKFLKRPYM